MNPVYRTIPALLATAVLASGCAGVSYRPVQETSFEQLAERGCPRGNDRFLVNAYINAAYRETVVLWNGRDASRTVAVRLPDEGIGSRLRGVVGKSRYELSVEQLEELRREGEPVTVTISCQGAERTPVADRFSYFENGQRVAFEF